MPSFRPTPARSAALVLVAGALLGVSIPTAHAGTAPADPVVSVECPDAPMHAYFDVSSGTVAALGPAEVPCTVTSPTPRLIRGSLRFEPTWTAHSVAHAEVTENGPRVGVQSEQPIPVGTATIAGTYGVAYRDDQGKLHEGHDTYVLVMHAIDKAPTCTDASVSTASGTAVAVRGSCTGEGAVTEVDQQPQHGTLSVPSADGEVIYTPDRGYSGPDSFRLRSSNVVGSALASVAVTVQAPPAPAAPAAKAAAPAAAFAPPAKLAGGPWLLQRTGDVQVVRNRRGRIRVSTGHVAICPAGVTACTGRITLKVWRRSSRPGRRFRVFLAGKVRPRSIPGGTASSIVLSLNRRGRRTLRELGSFSGVLRGSLRSDGEAPVVRETRVRIALPGT